MQVSHPVALDDLGVIKKQRRLTVVAEVSDAGFDHDRYLIDPHFVDQSGLECLSGQVAGSQGDVSFSSEGLRLSHINGLDDTVEAGGLDQLTAAEKINFWQRFEAFRSRLPLIDHASIANAEATDLAGEYCFSNLKLPLTRSLQLCPTEAASRVRAAAVGPRPSTEGEAKGPVLPQLLRRNAPGRWALSRCRLWHGLAETQPARPEPRPGCGVLCQSSRATTWNRVAFHECD